MLQLLRQWTVPDQSKKGTSVGLGATAGPERGFMVDLRVWLFSLDGPRSFKQGTELPLNLEQCYLRAPRGISCVIFNQVLLAGD